MNEFYMTLAVIGLFVVILGWLVGTIAKVFGVVARFLDVEKGIRQSNDIRKYVDETAEKVLRMIQQEMREKGQNCTLTGVIKEGETRLTDVLREAGIPPSMYNIQGVLRAKLDQLVLAGQWIVSKEK